MKTQQRSLSQTLAITCLLLPSIALAQDKPQREDFEKVTQGYVFSSVGKWTDDQSTLVGGGIGFERLIVKGFGLGGEVQINGPVGGYGSYGLLTFSGNGSYHFRNASRSGKLVPFVSGGYTGLAACSSECGGLNGFNVGGGINYWLKPSRGIRVEFRDHVFREYGYTIQKWETRFGFSF